MKRLFVAVALISLLLAPSGSMAGSDRSERATDFTFEAIDGKSMPLATFKGKVMLVVNYGLVLWLHPTIRGAPDVIRTL